MRNLRVTINKKDIPKPISKRQYLYVTSKADVTLFGGEFAPPIKTFLNGET